MRKIVIVLLIVVSLVVGLSFASSALYLGDADGDFVPVPNRIEFSTIDDWVVFSDSPFSLTEDTISAIELEQGIGTYIEFDFGEDYFYASNSYYIVDVDGSMYLEYIVSFDGLETGGSFYLPIMNTAYVPLLYRVYGPYSDVVSATVFGTGYNLHGDDIEVERFEFTIETDSDSYIDSTIAQMPLDYSPMMDYDFVQLEIAFGAPDSLGGSYSILYPLDTDYNSVYSSVNLLDIDVEVIEAPNFLDWLTRSVSSFLNTKIFTIGSVNVTLGVCLLVPLSMYFLVAFLKKFAGG